MKTPTCQLMLLQDRIKHIIPKYKVTYHREVSANLGEVSEDTPSIIVDSNWTVETTWTVESIDGMTYEVDSFKTVVFAESEAFLNSSLWFSLKPTVKKDKDKPDSIGPREYVVKYLRSLFGLQKRFASAAAGVLVSTPAETLQHIEGVDDPGQQIPGSIEESDPTISIRKEFDTYAAEFIAFLADLGKTGTSVITVPLLDEDGEVVYDKDKPVQSSVIDGTGLLRKLFAKRSVELDETIYEKVANLRIRVIGGSK